MARKKANDGVLATIERLTGKVPCPMYLRSALNKYLYQEQLFEGATAGNTHGRRKQLGQLRGPDTDNLVRNLLDLDALFSGETTTVIDVVTGAIDPNILNERLNDVEQSMQQRLDIYRYWLDRISSARSVLADPHLNLKVDRLDERLLAARNTEIPTIAPFALHALQVQEASEAKVRTGLPSAAEFVSRADAYLALDDLANADRNACSAIERDASCARGWFIRVAIALRRRQSAMRTFHRKRMEAQEFSEPLSGHERWANEQADESANDAWEHQQSLDAILSQAILHWPQNAGRREYGDLWKQVRNVFVGRMFAIAVHDVQRAGSREQWAHLNGLELEWELEHRKQPYASSSGLTGSSSFTAEETRAITNLLAVYDDKPQQFFDIIEGSRISTDFQLYHLRFALRMEGCDAHWAKLQAAVATSTLASQADNLMRDPTVAKLWQAHYCRHSQPAALVQSYAKWLKETQAQSNGRLRHSVLQQYAHLFHHQFVRRQFGLCGEVATEALTLFEGATALTGWFGWQPHPYDDSISMPLHQCRYWQYLAAVAAVEQRRKSESLSAQAQAILDDENRWREAFSEQATCFWTASMEYEEGCGEDWPEPPYGIDLREQENWAKEAQFVPNK
ncbi:hypothetical protein MRBLMS1_003398 [Massilia sp. LMS1-1-1.1]